MDALLERSEADPLALELEAGAQSRQRYEIVVDLGQLAGLSDGGLTEREVGVGGRHGRTLAYAHVNGKTAPGRMTAELPR